MVRFHGLPIIIASLLFMLPSFSWAQERCGTVEYEKMLHAKGSWLGAEQQFEQWMKNKITQRKKVFQTGKIESSTYTIPVVVHIIHNGEPVGTGLNISDAQVISQIQVINDDYKRLNADKTNTPSEFLPVASSIDIQFVLAQQDAEGLPTNGITRTLGSKTSYTISDNYEFKALNYWPAESYLNIWVINLTGGLIGYAQLPVSTQLQGLEVSSMERLTDGVVVDYKTFGSGSGFSLDSQFNKGRTATHEIGHFLGLRHIWGDGSCATDYVDDTPPQTSSTSGCPTNPQASCGTAAQPHKMFQNYLDYSDDGCMNLFTAGQIDRMNVILANSIRRTSLLTSPGATAPTLVTDDLGIRRIITPTPSSCNDPITPQIEVRNYGTNAVTSAKVQIALNGGPIETLTFLVNLSPSQTAIFSFSNLSFGNSNQQVSFQVVQTNNGMDGNAANNSSAVQVSVPVSMTLPIDEPFNSLPSSWQVVNSDGDITWANVIAPDSNPANRAMYMNFNSYQSEGAQDWLVTPSFAISNPTTAQLKFDVAYAQFPGVSTDTLKVYALPGCSNDLSQATLLYHKAGSALATTSSTSSSFIPSSDAQWRKSEVVSLNSLSIATTWQLVFIGRNGYGNNLYIDNAIIKEQLVNDLALVEIASPGLVHCITAPAIQFVVKNFSTVPITSFQAQRTLNGGTVVTQTFGNVLINIGELKTFSLDKVTLNNGVNQLALTLLLPNGFPDSNLSNNTLTFSSYLDQSADSAPLRITFDNPAEKPWLIASSGAAQPWLPVTTNKNHSIVYKAFTNTQIGEQSWFVSPVLDLTRYSNQSLFFDLSYAQHPPADDRIKVLGSTDCGLTYNLVLFDRPGSQFSTTISSTEWAPASDADWRRQYVSLDTLSGKSNTRIAIVAINEHGNNLYFDNLEIFAGDDSQPPVTSVPYQLYYSSHYTQSDLALTFNLPEKKDVRLQIYSTMGQIVADNLLTETLNQTYYFDLSIQATGLYMFRLQIDDQVSTTKVYIGH